MKNLIALSFSAAVLCCGLLTFTGCKSVPTVDPGTGQTNIVKQVDPQAIEGIRRVIEPGVARVLARTLQRSPKHAAEIRQYGSSVASIFCQMNANNNFSLAYLVDGANKATADLQSKMVDDPDTLADITAAKDTLVALFDLQAQQYLTWKLPENVWLQNITGLFCDVLTGALK